MKIFLIIYLSISMFNLEESHSLTNFDEGDPDWIIVNDGVMGGLSQSSILTSQDGIATFKGELSLKNNGGFASTRMRVIKKLPEDYKDIQLSIRGDGNIYNFRIRKNNRLDDLAYDAQFKTIKGKWTTVTLPLDEFQGTFRGRMHADKIGVLSEEIIQIGILIANKQEGEFVLDMNWIKLVK